MRAAHERFRWLSGDHHIHTLYSPDGMYGVGRYVAEATNVGLDWMVITDHGNHDHVRFGVTAVNPDIRAARAQFPGALVFQGLEWNIPGAEHGTVFVHPGSQEVSVLRDFEAAFDGVVRGATSWTDPNEVLALAGLDSLVESIRGGRVRDALFLANHPARNGLDSPHELRGWRDRAPGVAIGMEGAPGHQAVGMPWPQGPGAGRGFYEDRPGPHSFAAYPDEFYRTWGGYDAFTAVVGGLWDSMLAEGRPWWVTVNSDVHEVHRDTTVRGRGGSFHVHGRHPDPIDGGREMTSYGDFWPGGYSRTHVGARQRSYAAVMAGLRAGRIWVDHGWLLDSLSVVAQGESPDSAVPLGGTLTVPRGEVATIDMRVAPATRTNGSGYVPRLATVDVIVGEVTGPADDRDGFRAPSTRVVASFDVSDATGPVDLRHSLGAVETPQYVRLRMSDGQQTAPGFHGAAVDPAGPAIDELGNSDPWEDLWAYTNPIFVMPR